MVAVPDPVAATIQQLLTVSAVVTATVGRIADGLEDGWPMPTEAAIIRLASGPPGDQDMHYMKARIDVLCYGGEELGSYDVWALIDSVLCPGKEGITGFTKANCRVYDVARERMASSDVELDTKWPRTTCSYIFSWGGLPV